MKSKGFGSTARTALVYVLLAALWIFFSDRLLNAWPMDSALIVRLQTFKEWIFVAATGYALYALLNSGGRAEEALRIAHANYRSLFENATVGIFQSTPEGRFLSVNPATARIFGYTSPDEMLGEIKSIADQIYVDPAARDEFHRLIVKQGQVRDFNYQARRRDGAIIWIHEDARVVTGANGGVLHYEGFMTDVTERRRAEEERDQLAAIVESSEDAIISKTLDGVITSWNGGACRLYGFSAEEAIGKPVAFLVPPDRPDELPEILSRLRAGQKVAHLETVRIRKDGTAVNVAITVSPIRDAVGLVAAASSIAVDITERKRAEGALQESEARYRAVTETASDAIISSDSRGHIVGWNLAAETIFGYCASEVMGQPLTTIMPAAWHEGHMAGLARLQGEGQPRVVGRTIELEARRKGGSLFPVEFSLSDWQVADEHFYTAVLRDITERKRGEQELRLAKEALETTNVELQRSLGREEVLARTDALTGLCNRSYFDELASREFHAAVRYGRPLVVIMMDVDHFKQVNDTLGHAAGDEVLALIGRTAAAHTRTADVMARLGGDEFILLLPETTAEQALPIADRIVAGVAATPIHDSGRGLTVTLSAGISELRREPMDISVEQVVQRADQALYQAKAAGRNRTRLFDSATEDGAALNKGHHGQ